MWSPTRKSPMARALNKKPDPRPPRAPRRRGSTKYAGAVAPRGRRDSQSHRVTARAQPQQARPAAAAPVRPGRRRARAVSGTGTGAGAWGGVAPRAEGRRLEVRSPVLARGAPPPRARGRRGASAVGSLVLVHFAFSESRFRSGVDWSRQRPAGRGTRQHLTPVFAVLFGFVCATVTRARSRKILRAIE